MNEWMLKGKCRGMDPNVFFPPRGDVELIRIARAVCADCPVIDECREAGMWERQGVWGGLSERQRVRLRAQRRISGEVPVRTWVCSQCGSRFEAPVKVGGRPSLCSDSCRIDARRMTVRSSRQRRAS